LRIIKFITSYRQTVSAELSLAEEFVTDFTELKFFGFVYFIC